MDFSLDLAALYADHGVDVSIDVDGATQTARGYFTAPGAATLGGAGVSTDYAVEIATASLPGLRTGGTVTISGVIYKAREIWPLDDGSIRRVTLRRA
jgi:hypothetical protein